MTEGDTGENIELTSRQLGGLLDANRGDHLVTEHLELLAQLLVIHTVSEHAQLGVRGTNLLPLSAIHDAAALTVARTIHVAAGIDDSEVLLQATGGHCDLFKNLVPQAHRGVHATVEHATDKTRNDHRHGDQRVQAFVTNLVVILMGNNLGAQVVTDTHRAARGQHATTDTRTRFHSQILQGRSTQANPVVDLHLRVIGDFRIHCDRNTSRIL